MKLFRSLLVGLALAVLTSGSALAQCGTTAPANKFCGNGTGASALATWGSVPTGALSAILGGTVLGNRSGVSAVPTAVTNPVLGIPGASTGEVGLSGITSGTAILRAQAAAGSAVSLLPTSAGTLVSTASSPLAVNATTGLMTCPTCVTSSGGGAITGTAPIAVSAAGAVSINAPYVALTASNGGIVYSGATNLAILAGTATARQMLQSGASTTPAWSTTTWPATSTINRVLYSSAANVVGEIATANGGLLNTSSAGAPSITAAPVLGVAGTTVGSIGFQNLTSGTVTLQPVTGALGTVTINIPAAAGTLAVSATAPITLSAAGAIGITTAALTKTDDTNVTVTLGGTPGSALVNATSLTLGWTGTLALTRGGCGASLTASNGGVVYTNATSCAVLAGTATANLPLLSGSSTTPSWATISYPASATSGGLAYFSSTSAMASSAVLTANNPVIGGGAGVAPSSGARSGNTTTFATTSGTLPSGNCARFDASGNVVDAQSTCGGAVVNLAARGGGFDVWQRLFGGATTLAQAASTTAYENDGWYLISGANQASTITQATGIASGSVYAAKVQRNSGQTGTTTMRYAMPLDTDELVPAQGSFVALSFTVKAGANWSPTSGTLQYVVYCGTAAPTKRGAVAYTGETSVISTSTNITTTATRITVTGASVFPTNCTQTEIQFAWTPVGTAGADDSFTVDDLQLEIVSSASASATAYQKIVAGLQLEQAQRFFFAVANDAASAVNMAFGMCYSTTDGFFALALPVTMRTKPTGLTVNAVGSFNITPATLTGQTALSLTFNTATKSEVTWTVNVASGLTTGQGCAFGFTANTGLLSFTGAEI
jgi:hypothetical protein